MSEVRYIPIGDADLWERLRISIDNMDSVSKSTYGGLPILSSDIAIDLLNSWNSMCFTRWGTATSLVHFGETDFSKNIGRVDELHLSTLSTFINDNLIGRKAYFDVGDKPPVGLFAIELFWGSMSASQARGYFVNYYGIPEPDVPLYDAIHGKLP